MHRCPAQDTDTGKHHLDSRHAVALHRGVFYRLDLLTDDNAVVSVTELQAKLRWITTQSGGRREVKGKIRGQDSDCMGR